MGRIVLAGVAAVVIAELAALALDRRSLVVVVGGVVLVLVVFVMRTWLGEPEEETVEPADDAAAEALLRWHARTTVMISWSEGTRGDWDRHLRPLLAQEFQMSTGHRLSKDPAALDASGRMLFGADLWAWVDPAAVTSRQRDDPAPGRDHLDEILRRLESL